WIGMVLVDEVFRGRGIGTALLRHALEFLAGRRVSTVRLDATPLGRPLYERLGFVEQFQLARYEGTPLPTPLVAEVQTPRPEEWEMLAALDQAIVGTDRCRLLFRLFTEQPESLRLVRNGDGIAGFIATRSGRNALLVGPCIASPEAGPLLLADAWNRYAG